jgi:hypothetical protein
VFTIQSGRVGLIRDLQKLGGLFRKRPKEARGEDRPSSAAVRPPGVTRTPGTRREEQRGVDFKKRNVRSI